MSDGWRLGGAALDFVLGIRVLKRFVLAAAGTVLVASAAVAVAAVVLRREAGPVAYALAGLGAYYSWSLVAIAVAVGLASLVADSLDSRPVNIGDGWRVIERRRGSIAGWAVLDLVLGLPNRTIGSWTVNQLGVLLIGFGWGVIPSWGDRTLSPPLVGIAVIVEALVVTGRVVPSSATSPGGHQMSVSAETRRDATASRSVNSARSGGPARERRSAQASPLPPLSRRGLGGAGRT